VSAPEGEGGSENNFSASKALIGPYLISIRLKILDSVTSLGRTKLNNTHAKNLSSILKLLKAGLG
jgi:hypothetical protein